MIDSQNASARRKEACTSGLDASAVAKKRTTMSNSFVTGSLVASELDSAEVTPDVMSVTSSLVALEVSTEFEVVSPVEELGVTGAELVGNVGSGADVVVTGTLATVVVDGLVVNVIVEETDGSERGFSTVVGTAASAPVSVPAESERLPPTSPWQAPALADATRRAPRDIKQNEDFGRPGRNRFMRFETEVQPERVRVWLVRRAASSSPHSISASRGTRSCPTLERLDLFDETRIDVSPAF